MGWLQMALSAQDAGVMAYHERLLENPGSETLYQRFVDGWLDTGSREELEGFLTDGAGKGEAGALVWAKYLVGQGREGEAVEVMDRAIKEKPSSALSIARARLRAGMLDLEGAMEDLEKAGELSPEIRLEKAGWLARAGEMERARAEWTALLEERPDDEELREDLIALLRGEGQREEAAGLLEKLIASTRDPYQKALRMLELAGLESADGEPVATARFIEVLGMTGADSWLEGETLARVEREFLQRGDTPGLRAYYAELRDAFPHRINLRKGLARQMIALGEIDEGFALFREVLKATPGDRGNREELVELLAKEGRFGEAREEVAALLDVQPDRELYGMLAGLCEKSGDRDGCLDALEKMVALDGGEGEWLNAVEAFGRFDFAERMEALLRSKAEESPRVREALGVFLVGSDKDERRNEGAALIEGLAKGEGEVERARLGNLLLRARLPEVASRVAREGLSAFPANELLGDLVCHAALALGKPEEAWRQGLAMLGEAKADALRVALERAERMARGWEGARGELEAKAEKSPREWAVLACLLEGGEREKAMAKVRTIEPALAGFLEIRFLREEGRFGEAANRLLENGGSQRPQSLREAVELYKRGGDSERALACLAEWKQLAPGDQSVWLAQVALLQENGQADEAILELRRAMARFGSEEVFRVKLAEAFRSKGDREEADRIYRQLYQSSEKTDDKLSFLKRRLELLDYRAPVALLEEFEERRRNQPRSIKPLLALELIHATMGHEGERVLLMKEAARLDPDNREVSRRLANLAEALGNYEEAETVYRKLAETTGQKRELVEYYQRAGEEEKWFALAMEMARDDVAEMERLALDLFRSDRLARGLDVLAGAPPEDWRLSYLRGLIFLKMGKREEAQAVFRGLTHASGELPGRTSANFIGLRGQLGMPNWSRAEYLQYSGEFKLWNEQYLETNFGSSPASLPDTPEDCRDRAYQHLVSATVNLTGDERMAAIREIGLPDELLWQRDLRGDGFEKWLREELESGRIGAADALDEIPWGGLDEDLQDFVMAKVAEESKDPAVRVRMALSRFSRFGGNIPAKVIDDFARDWPELDARQQDEFGHAFIAMWWDPSLHFHGEENSFDHETELKFIDLLLEVIETSPGSSSLGEYSRVSGEARNLLSLDDDRVVRLLNAMCASARIDGWRQMQRHGFSDDSKWMAAGVPAGVWEDLLRRDAGTSFEEDVLQFERSLTKDEGADENEKVTLKGRLTGLVDRLAEPSLRVLVRMANGDEDGVKKEVEALLAAGDVPRHLLAAFLCREHLGEPERAMKILLAADEQARGRDERAMVDQALLEGWDSFEKELQADEALRERVIAAFRRDALNPAGFPNTALANDLGQEEFLEKLQQRRQTTNSGAHASVIQFAVPNFMQRTMALLEDGKKEEALARMTREWEPRNRAGLLLDLADIIELLKDEAIRDRFLEGIRPGDEVTKAKALAYLNLLDALKMTEEAWPVAKQLLERPGLTEDEKWFIRKFEPLEDWWARVGELRVNDPKAFAAEIHWLLNERFSQASDKEAAEVFEKLIPWIEEAMRSKNGADAVWVERVLNFFTGPLRNGGRLERIVKGANGPDARVEAYRRILRQGLEWAELEVWIFSQLQQQASVLAVSEEEIHEAALNILRRRLQREEPVRSVFLFGDPTGLSKTPEFHLECWLLGKKESYPEEEMALLRAVAPERAEHLLILASLRSGDWEESVRNWLANDPKENLEVSKLPELLAECSLREFEGPGIAVLGDDFIARCSREQLLKNGGLIAWLGQVQLRCNGVEAFREWHANLLGLLIGSPEMQERWAGIRSRDRLPAGLLELNKVLEDIAVAALEAAPDAKLAVGFFKTGLLDVNDSRLIGKLGIIWFSSGADVDLEERFEQAGIWSESLGWWLAPRGKARLGVWGQLLGPQGKDSQVLARWQKSSHPRKVLAAVWLNRNINETVEDLEGVAPAILAWEEDDLRLVARMLDLKWRKAAAFVAGPEASKLIARLNEFGQEATLEELDRRLENGSDPDEIQECLSTEEGGLFWSAVFKNKPAKAARLWMMDEPALLKIAARNETSYWARLNTARRLHELLQAVDHRTRIGVLMELLEAGSQVAGWVDLKSDNGIFREIFGDYEAISGFPDRAELVAVWGQYGRARQDHGVAGRVEAWVVAGGFLTWPIPSRFPDGGLAEADLMAEPRIAGPMAASLLGQLGKRTSGEELATLQSDCDRALAGLLRDEEIPLAWRLELLGPWVSSMGPESCRALAELVKDPAYLATKWAGWILLEFIKSNPPQMVTWNDALAEMVKNFHESVEKDLPREVDGGQLLATALWTGREDLVRDLAGLMEDSLKGDLSLLLFLAGGEGTEDLVAGLMSNGRDEDFEPYTEQAWMAAWPERLRKGVHSLPLMMGNAPGRYVEEVKVVELFGGYLGEDLDPVIAGLVERFGQEAPLDEDVRKRILRKLIGYPQAVALLPSYDEWIETRAGGEVPDWVAHGLWLLQGYVRLNVRAGRDGRNHEILVNLLNRKGPRALPLSGWLRGYTLGMMEELEEGGECRAKWVDSIGLILEKLTGKEDPRNYMAAADAQMEDLCALFAFVHGMNGTGDSVADWLADHDEVLRRFVRGAAMMPDSLMGKELMRRFPKASRRFAIEVTQVPGFLEWESTRTTMSPVFIVQYRCPNVPVADLLPHVARERVIWGDFKEETRLETQSEDAIREIYRDLKEWADDRSDVRRSTDFRLGFALWLGSQGHVAEAEKELAAIPEGQLSERQTEWIAKQRAVWIEGEVIEPVRD